MKCWDCHQEIKPHEARSETPSGGKYHLVCPVGASEAQPPQAGSPSATGSARVSEPEAGAGSSGRSAQNSGFPALVERVKHARALSHECLMTYRKMELRDQENFALGQFDAFAAVLKWIRVAPENAHPAAGERALARNDKLRDGATEGRPSSPET